jgi:hypothetical protein
MPASLDGIPMRDNGLPDGTPVQVLTHFKQTWASGFAIAGTEPADTGTAYLVRRISDNALLPASFGAGELRPEPR